MYRNRFDQYDHEQYHEDVDAEVCPKEHYRSEKQAEIALDLAVTKARRGGYAEPIRVYQCTNAAAACFYEFHLTSSELR